MRDLMIRAGTAGGVLWASCLAAALLAFSCSKSEEADKTVAQSAEVTSEALKEVAPAETAAAIEVAPSAEPEADNSEGGAAEAESADDKKPVSHVQDNAEAAEKPAPEKKNTAPVGETQKAPPKSEGYTGPNPCRSKKFSFSSVKNACNKGGVAQAKELMKGFTKKGKAQGKNWKCSTCHDSTKTYTNKPNAVKELKSIF